MAIDWGVVLFEVLNFGVLVALMARFLFRPIRAAVEKRRDEAEQLRKEVEQREAETKAERAKLDAALTQIDETARESQREAAAAAQTKAEQIVADARAQVREALARSREEIEANRRSTLTEIRTEVFKLATAAAARVVRGMEAATVTQAFVRRAAHALDDALGGTVPTAAIVVEIGPDADPDAVKACLRDVLGPQAQFEMHTDASVIGGARLRVAGHEVESSASATLAQWYQRRIADGPGTESGPIDLTG